MGGNEFCGNSTPKRVILRNGIQGHLEPGVGTFDSTSFRQFLSDVAGLGLHIMITELDVADDHLPGATQQRDQMVADAYSQFLDATLDEKAVIAVITWGLADKESWLSAYRPRADRLPVRSLPFDDDYRPNPAWFAIARSLEKAPKRQIFSIY